MSLPTTATLEYVALTFSVPVATALTRIAAVPLYSGPSNDPVINGLFDCTVISDVSGTGVDSVTRTIVLGLGAGFFTLFPTSADWSGAFNDLFGRTLALALPSAVTSLPVVFS